MMSVSNDYYLSYDNYMSEELLDNIPGFGTLHELTTTTTTNSPSTNSSPHHDVDHSFATYWRYWQYYEVVTFGIQIIVNVVALPLALHLICVLSRFKELQTRGHRFILHYTIWNTVYFFSLPIFQFLHMLGLRHILHSSIVCGFYRLDSVSASLLLTFIAAMGIDWFIRSTDCCGYERLPVMRYIFWGTYAVHLIGFLVTTSSQCFHYTELLTNNPTMFYYATLATVLIVVNLRTFLKCPSLVHQDTRYFLSISSRIVLIWAPPFVMDIVEELAGSWIYWSDDQFLVMGISLVLTSVHFICGCVMVLGPALIMYWLCKWDKEFGKRWRVVWRRARGYKMDDLEDHLVVENSVYRPTTV